MGSLSPSDPSPVSFRTSDSETLGASESHGKLGKADFQVPSLAILACTWGLTCP